MREVSWPLTGRDHDLATIRAAHVDPALHSITLAGPAGVGKSRLAHEFASTVAERGGVVTRVLATRAASGLPLGAFAGALPALAGMNGSAPETLLGEVTRSLRAVAAGREAVVLVDDAHLLDDVSATLALNIASTRSAFVVATMRTGERCPDAVTALWKEGSGARHDVEPLGADTVERLLVDVLGGPVDPPSARLLAQRCEGNVLFLIELVRGLRASGVLGLHHDTWHLIGEIAPSPRLADLIQSGLVEMGDSERDALAHVAFGEPLRLDDVPERVQESALSALEQRRLITSDFDGAQTVLRLAHPLYGDVVRATVPALARRSVLRALADSAQRREPVDDGQLLRIALWRLDAGDPGDPDQLLAAAAVARTRCDYALTERLARTALEGGAGLSADLLLAEMEFVTGRFAECEQRLARRVGDVHTAQDRLRFVSLRMDNLMYGLGDTRAALSVAETAQDTGADRSTADQFVSMRASAHYIAGEWQTVAELLFPILTEREIPGQRVISRTILVIALAAIGRIEDALGIVAATSPDFSATFEEAVWPPWILEFAHCMTLLLAGRPDEMRHVASPAHDRAITDGDRWAEGAFAMMIGFALAQRGDVASAAMWTRRGVSTLRGTPNPMFFTMAGANHVLVQALAGDVDAAQQAADQLDVVPWSGASKFWWGRARAWLQVARGDHAAARTGLLEVAAMMDGLNSPPRCVVVLHDLARIGYPEEVLERLRSAAERMDGDWGHLCARHAAALTRRDATALVECSAQFEAAGMVLLAAEAAADASVILARAGESKAASAAQRRAQELSAALGNPLTPALAPLSTRVELTRAERTVAELAAAGHSNRAIAERLVLSVRTVENTLQRVYNKLGLAGRAGLKDAL